ncbi:MAG: NGG1p interacting factor NIF3, partial [Syntrophomonadaceae bacterium]
MKLVDIYKLAVDLGKRYDIRGNDLSRFLQEELERFDRLTEAEKEHYDLQKLEHPYSDTRILSGDPSTEVHT